MCTSDSTGMFDSTGNFYLCVCVRHTYCRVSVSMEKREQGCQSLKVVPRLAQEWKNILNRFKVQTFDSINNCSRVYHVGLSKTFTKNCSAGRLPGERLCKPGLGRALKQSSPRRFRCTVRHTGANLVRPVERISRGFRKDELSMTTHREEVFTSPHSQSCYLLLLVAYSWDRFTGCFQLTILYCVYSDCCCLLSHIHHHDVVREPGGSLITDSSIFFPY